MEKVIKNLDVYLNVSFHFDCKTSEIFFLNLDLSCEVLGYQNLTSVCALVKQYITLCAKSVSLLY